MAVTKKQAADISAEIKVAVEAILKKHGMATSKISTNYGDIYRFKVDAAPLTLGANGVNITSPEAEAYTTLGGAYGLKPGLLGKVFKSNGTEYAFAGIATSRSKYPLMAVNPLDGKHYFFTESIVERINAA